MSWVLLVAAGALEVVWASLLPSTASFTRPLPTAAFALALGGSMLGLARASQTIPIGTAYVVWVGIGAVGAATVGMVRGEPATPLRVTCLALVVLGIAGLKVAGDQ